MGRRAGGPA